MTKKDVHIVYIISQVQKSMAFEWIAVELKKHYKLSIVLLNPAGSSLEDFFVQNNIEVKRFKFSGKLDYPKTFVQLSLFLLRKRPDIIHSHLLDAQLLGLTAAWFIGIKKRIYTRHHSNFHHVYFRKGVKYDKWSNHLATHIISISQATFRTLIDLERVKKSKIREIHHGFRLSVFQHPGKEKIDLIRARWQINGTYPCIGVIARHIEWKGIQFIIPAFEKLLNDYPGATLVLANANGPYHQPLVERLAAIPKSKYVLIPFEEDIASLYAVFDIYVHVPVDEICEAFGQTYVEALAAEIPSVFTRSGIASEFIGHKENAWVVDHRNSHEIYNGMKGLLKDVALQQKLKLQGKKSVEELFGFEGMMTKLKLLYDE